ncbi:MAG: hypothetical protein RSB41_02765 [Bacilli bacterium]
MDTNFEAIKSLIELLVKKSGFDLSKRFSSEQLEKTKDAINKLNIEKKDDNSNLNKKEVDILLSELKDRLSMWEHNAEVVGRELLKSYKEGRTLDQELSQIELLSSLAKEDTEHISSGSLMSYIYSTINKYENEISLLEEKVKNNNYLNTQDKELDIKLSKYLDNKENEYKEELKYICEELDRLRDVESSDVGAIERLKKHLTKISQDIKRLDDLKKDNLNKGITIELWEKIEKVEAEIKDKESQATNNLSKIERTLEEVRKNRIEYNSRKKSIEEETSKVKNKLKSLTEKINNNDYIDYTAKVIDEHDLELYRSKIERLKNKKEVIYIDVQRIKEEILSSWNKEENTNNIKQNENLTPPVTIESDLITEEDEDYKVEEAIEKVENENRDTIDTQNKRIELDW